MQNLGQGFGAWLEVKTPRSGTGNAAVNLFALQQTGNSGGGGVTQERDAIADFDGMPAIPVLVVRADIRGDQFDALQGRNG